MQLSPTSANVSQAVAKLEQFARFIQMVEPHKTYFADKPVIQFVGAAASINLGDRLLYLAIRELMSACNLVPNSPTSTVTNKVSRALVRHAGQFALRGVRRPIATMLGGGTLIGDNYFLRLLMEYHREDLPFYVFGTSVEYAEMFGDTLGYWKPYLRRARRVWVRDPHAVERLATLDVEGQVIGDPVLALCRPERRSLKGRPAKIGINVMMAQAAMFGQQEMVTQALAETARELAANGHSISFFALHPWDLSNVEEARARAGLQDAPLWSAHADAESYLREIEKLDLLVGQRLHAAVASTGFAIPTLSISYRPKCINYMESIGQRDRCIKTDDVSTQAVLDGVDSLLSDYESVNADLIARVTAYQATMRKAAAELVTDLAS